MNKKLQKKIKAYAGFAGAIVAADKANGQVVYVDIDPDTVVMYGYAPDPIDFDVNQDGYNDVTFLYNRVMSIYYFPLVLNTRVIEVRNLYSDNLLKGSYTNCGYFNSIPNAIPLNQGDSIPSANQINNFRSYVKLINWYSSSTGGGGSDPICSHAITPFNQDDYLGFRFIMNGQYHYGWFKFELLDQPERGVKIKEYAYQLQPNVPTLAGDTTNAINFPTASITPQGPLSFCSGGSVLLSANAGAGLSYQWKRYGIPIPGATAQNYLATAAGRYRVVVTNAAGSKTSAPVIVTVPCVPVEDPVEKTGMEISDRQFSFSQQNNSFHISFFENLNALSISVYDLIGKEIFKKTFSGNEASFTIEKKGIYFAEVDSEKGIFRKKIFIY